MREVLASCKDAYAVGRQEGLVASARLLSSHLAQIFVGCGAFFAFNLGRYLQDLWHRMRSVL